MWTVLDHSGAAIAQLGMCQNEDLKVFGWIACVYVCMHVCMRVRKCIYIYIYVKYTHIMRIYVYVCKYIRLGLLRGSVE